MGFMDSNPGDGFIKSNDAKVGMDSESLEYKTLIPAVLVNNANKRYGKGPPILQNFSMTVQRGTIYGLLGASGCGKTTILSSIVGLQSLDSGEIKVFGAKPGTRESGIPGRTIGYMPQDIALYQIFSIEEILNYFGRIYGMTTVEIKARLQFLSNFLDLPDRDRKINTLSGGQQRRTSLAVAMVHQPRLLILDEPTVGVDPLIRESIWEYLCEMVARRQTTVIITTHYIEEARQSNMIGLMRNGRLLTEKPPKTLLEEYNTDLLEDIVLKLCKKDNSMLFPDEGLESADQITRAISETSFYSRRKKRSQLFQNIREEDANSGSIVGLKYKTRSPDDVTISKPRNTFLGVGARPRDKLGDAVESHINKITSIVKRNFLTLIRYPLFMVSLILIPTFQSAVFNVVVGKDPKYTPVAVVNNEFSNTNFFDNCDKRIPGCFRDGISCQFFKQFPDDQILWMPYDTEENALKSVHHGTTWGFLIIPKNFTHQMKERALLKNFATNETLDGTTLLSSLDMSFSLKGGFLRASLYSGYLKFVKGLVDECGGDSRAIEVPMKYKAIYGSLDGGSKEFLQPGQITLTIFLLPMVNAVTMVWDKKAGTLDRTMVAGVSFIHFIIALIITEGTMILLELSIMFAVLIFVFNFNIIGSFGLAFFLSLLQGFCGLSFGILFGTLCNHELEALVCILGLYLPILVSSGGTWPIEGLVGWARSICELLPTTLPTHSMRGISNRGWGLLHPQVWPGFVIVSTWTGAIILVCLVVHRLRK